MSDHAGGFPVAGQHDFGGGRAARRQFGREPDPATVRRHARLDAGGAGGGGEAAPRERVAARPDIVRTSGDNYHMVLGSQLLYEHGVATLNVDRQVAAEFMDDPPTLFSKLLVAARIDKIEPIILGLKPCSDPECGEVELGILPSHFGSMIWRLPWFRAFGTAVAVTRE